jgi:hypothetical protein
MPTVSKTGAHSNEFSLEAFVATSMDIMPSVSMAMREQSLLNPTHEREDPLLMHETDPLEMMLQATAS